MRSSWTSNFAYGCRCPSSWAAGLAWGLFWALWGSLAQAQEPAPAWERYDCADEAQMGVLVREAVEREGQPGVLPRLMKVELACDPSVCTSEVLTRRMTRVLGLCAGLPAVEPKRQESPPPTSKALSVLLEEARRKGEEAATERGEPDPLEAEAPEGVKPEPAAQPGPQGPPSVRSLLNAGRQRLLKTGFFEEVTFKTRAVPGGVEVTFQAQAARIIRKIEYGEVAPLLELEVSKRVQLRRGQALSGDARLKKEKEDSVADLYQQNGFYGTEVHIVEKPVEGTNLVDIEVQIKRGRELKVSRVVIGGHKVLDYAKLRSLLLEPIGWFGAYRDSALKEGIGLVLDEYRQRGYFRARVVDKWINPDQAKGTVEVRLELDEGARWELSFVGNRFFTDAELREKTTFGASGYVDELEIARSADAIEKLYETAGFFFADVEAEEIEGPNAQRTITFRVQEGTQGGIVEVAFVGNKTMSERDLLDVMQTRPYGLLSAGGTLQRDEIEADLGRIVEAYQRRGYLQARAVRWELEALDKGETFRVKIFLEEGAQTLVERVEVVGNEAIGLSEVRARLSVKEGAPLSVGGLQDDTGRLLQMYNPLGYAGANVYAECSTDGRRWGACEAPRVAPECVPKTAQERQRLKLCGDGMKDGRMSCLRTPPTRECQPQGGVGSERVKVRFVVTEGEPVKVGEIFVRGNFKTKDRVIYRSLPFRKGQQFSRDKLYEGQSELRSIGLFESVSFRTIGLEGDAISQVTRDSEVGLVILVEELPASFWELRFGFETRNLLQEGSSLIAKLETALVENNLFGQGQGVQLKLQFAFDLFQIIDVFDPANSEILQTFECVECLDYYVTTQLLFFDPRSVFFRSQLTVSSFYTLDLLGVEDQNVEKEQVGVRASIRTELAERLVGQVALEQSWTTTRTSSDDPRNAAGERLFSPLRTSTGPSVKLSYDKRNSPLNPTRGYYLELTPELAFDFLLDSGTNFFKISGGGSQFWTYFQALTLAYGFRFGFAKPLLGAQVIPEDEVFRLGGVGSLRGFAINSVGPLSSNLFSSRGGDFLLRGSTELRFPLFRELDLYGAWFGDAGLLVDCRRNVSPLEAPGSGERIDCLDDVHLEDVRLSGGVGLRWLALGQIPVVLDYGVILDRKLGEEFGDLQVNVGYNF